MQILQSQEVVMEKGGVLKLKQIAKGNPTFSSKIFNFFPPLYMIHIPPLDFSFEQNFTHKKTLIQRCIFNKISI
jgi:hypothetical protein